MTGRRLVLAGVAFNLVLVAIALGWLTWISAAPRYWFADAYAAQGPRGEQGQRGEQGPVGPAGPVGPDAIDAIEELRSELFDVSDRLETLEGDLASLQSESGSSDLESDVIDTRDRVEAICDQLFQYTGALEDIYYAAC